MRKKLLIIIKTIYNLMMVRLLDC